MKINNSSLNVPSPQSAQDSQLRAAAEGLESAFIQQMYEIMRNSVPESEMSMNNTATRIYQSMLDREYADISARQMDLGLADQIVAYLGGGTYNNNQPQPLSTGGTHEDSVTKQKSGTVERSQKNQ